MLTGPPGIGKRCWPTTSGASAAAERESEALEVTAIHSVAGLLADGHPTDHPAAAGGAAPYLQCRGAGRGGLPGMARPGCGQPERIAASCSSTNAPRSAAACSSAANSVGRGEVRLARGTAWPATGPLPAGAGGEPVPIAPADPKDCICGGAVKRRYLGKLSGPLMDRVDLHVQMDPQCGPGRSPTPREVNRRPWCGPAWRRHAPLPPNAGVPSVCAPMPRCRDRFCAAGIGSPGGDGSSAHRVGPGSAEHPRRRPLSAGRVESADLNGRTSRPRWRTPRRH